MAEGTIGVTGPAKSPAQQAAFGELIARQAPTVQELARAARALILRLLPGTIESVWLQQGTCSYGTGPRKMKDHFAYFVFAKGHLTLGLYQGAQLPDPKGLLAGTGKAMRSTKIATRADLESPALQQLLKAAIALAPPLST